MAVANPLLRIRQATFRYDDREVLKGIDLDVCRGEVLSILGPNGCGKTTLLRCISGTLAPSSGSVLLDGLEVGGLDPTARARKIGILFQEHTPSFPFTIRDVVLMGRAPHLGWWGSPGARDLALAHEALERVGMIHLSDRPYTRVSGGERRLVLIARTLVQRPDVILLDEPTSHLDFRNQLLTLRIIRSLAADGLTMIMTTHDPNHPLWLGGPAALMKDGQIIASGAGSAVLTTANLSAAYGIGVGVFTANDPTGEFRFCTALHS